MIQQEEIVKNGIVSAQAIVVMGVTGSGKSTVGKMLAEKLGWEFYDADDFHPEENVEKMRGGVPLDDEDRLPWLKALSELIRTSTSQGSSLVLACSALKRCYRDIIAEGNANAHFVYLKGDESLIGGRLACRKGHYMNPKLLPSQFAALEEPDSREAFHVDIHPEPETIVANILNEISHIT